MEVSVSVSSIGLKFFSKFLVFFHCVYLFMVRNG